MKKIYQVLSLEQLRSSVVQVFLLIIAMFFETLSIGLLFPVLSFMSEESTFSNYPLVKSLIQQLGNPTQKQLVIGTMILLVVVYFCKMIFMALLAWRQSKFIFNVQIYFSQKLFVGYMRQPYTFHLQRNSAQLIRNVTGVVGSLTTSLTAILSLLTEFFTALGLVTLLLLAEPIGTLAIVVVLGLSGWLFQRFTRNKILQWGAALQFHEGMRIQHIQQGLGGAKDVKLMGREEDFLKQYRFHNNGIAKAGIKQQTIAAFPRLFLEMLAVLGMASLVFFMLANGKPLDSIVLVLGLFAASAFRLIPSLNRILAAFQTLRYAEPAVEAIVQEFKLINSIIKQKKDYAAIPFKSTLSLHQVSFKYPSADKGALHDLSISIAVGTTTGFIGTTGAGKSTLVDIILGLLTPDKGHVKIDNVDIETNLRGWQDQIGYVPQVIFLTDDSLRRNVAFGLLNEQIDEDAIWQAIRSAQLEEFVKDLPDGLDTLVGERGIRLSGGQRQRIGIARALYHNPPILVLDEATSSLDTITEKGVMEAVTSLKQSKTIIIVAHRLSTIEHCDLIFRLDKGKIIEEGNPIKMLQTIAVQSK